MYGKQPDLIENADRSQSKLHRQRWKRVQGQANPWSATPAIPPSPSSPHQPTTPAHPQPTPAQPTHPHHHSPPTAHHHRPPVAHHHRPPARGGPTLDDRSTRGTGLASRVGPPLAGGLWWWATGGLPAAASVADVALARASVTA